MSSTRALFLGATLVLGVLASSGLTGCGSTKTVEKPQQSVGQQLQDLDKSYKDGIITKKEYDRLRSAIIRNND